MFIIFVLRFGIQLPVSLILNLIGRLLLFSTCTGKTLFVMYGYQHLFLQQHTAISVPALGGEMKWQSHLPPQVEIEPHSNVNPCPLIYGWIIHIMYQNDFILFK